MGRDTVRELNQRARTDRLTTTSQPVEREVALGDGTRASAGDLVITRRNDRRLRARDGSWVKNGDRWHLLDVHADGSVRVERRDTRTRAGAATSRVTLPAGYVAEQVQLGYASTIHGAQGSTVDTTHTVLTGAESRQGLYVALSRGRATNHAYVGHPTPTLDGVVSHDVPEVSVDPREVLTDILARDGRALSATTIERGDAAKDLRQAVLAYQDALPVLAQHHLGPQRMAALDDALEEWMPGLTAAPAYPHLRGQLALHWVDGTPPGTACEQTTLHWGTQSLTEAEDPAAVLAWRVARTHPTMHRDAPLTWLPDTPPALRKDSETSGYLDRLTHRIDHLKERLSVEAHQAAADRAPWRNALPPDVDDHLIGDLAVWRAAHAIPPTDLNPTGPRPNEPDAARYQARLNQRLRTPVEVLSTQTARAERERQQASKPANDTMGSIGSTNTPHAT